MPHSLETSILRQCAERSPGQTLCPTEAAREYAREIGGGELAWRDHVQNVRSIAIRLARNGQIVLYRDGHLLDPETANGGYRLALARID